jgi:hypothetical protein
LDIFSLMHAADKVWITDLTDIENYLSVWRHTHFDVTDCKHSYNFTITLHLPSLHVRPNITMIIRPIIYRITSVLKVETDIISNIAASFWLAEISKIFLWNHTLDKKFPYIYYRVSILKSSSDFVCEIWI